MVGAQLGALVIAVLVLLVVWNTRRPPVVTITVADDQLTVRMGGWDIVYCCRREVCVPLSAVEGVCVARRDAVPAQGLRLPGTGIPGVIRAGSFGSADERDFWDVRRAEQVLVIQMRPGMAEYRRIVVEVQDPHAEMLRLRPVVGAAVLPLPAAL